MALDVFGGNDNPDPAVPSSLILQTVATHEALMDASGALERLWSVHDRVPEEIRIHTAIAVTEIVANIIEHGGCPDRLVRIGMHAAIEPHRVAITIIDDGDEAPVEVDAIAMPDHLAERGRGLALAQHVLDSFDYQRHSGSNHWLLTSKSF